jgi:hypothetical protein
MIICDRVLAFVFVGVRREGQNFIRTVANTPQIFSSLNFFFFREFTFDVLVPIPNT